jgi:hypothetical protein
VTGSERYGFKVVKNVKSEERDRIRVSEINEEQLLSYYEKLLVKGKKRKRNRKTVINEFYQISVEELENALNASGNSKAPGTDNINMELCKYGNKK